MFVFRCIVSVLLTVLGVIFLIRMTVHEWLLFWFAAAVVVPFEAADVKFCKAAAGLCGIVGIYHFFAIEDTFALVFGLGIAVIIAIKIYRSNKLIEEAKRGYRISSSSGYSSSGYSGGYSSSSSTYSSSSSTYSSRSAAYDDDSETYSPHSYDYDAEDRARRQRDEEERERYRRDQEERDRRLQELEEERQRQEALEAENRRREAEDLSRRKYGCSADISSNWDDDIRSRL